MVVNCVYAIVWVSTRAKPNLEWWIREAAKKITIHNGKQFSTILSLEHQPPLFPFLLRSDFFSPFLILLILVYIFYIYASTRSIQPRPPQKWHIILKVVEVFLHNLLVPFPILPSMFISLCDDPWYCLHNFFLSYNSFTFACILIESSLKIILRPVFSKM